MRRYSCSRPPLISLFCARSQPNRPGLCRLRQIYFDRAYIQSNQPRCLQWISLPGTLVFPLYSGVCSRGWPDVHLRQFEASPHWHTPTRHNGVIKGLRTWITAMPLFKSSKSLPYRELGNCETPQEPAVSGLPFFSPVIRICDEIISYW